MFSRMSQRDKVKLYWKPEGETWKTRFNKTFIYFISIIFSEFQEPQSLLAECSMTQGVRAV